MNTMIAQAERNELMGLISFLKPAEMLAINSWLAMSPTVWKGVIDEKLLCLWGLIPPTLLSDQAYLWLLTTEAASEHEFILVRRSQIEMKRMLDMYPRIVGHCEVSATRSIRWLRWLGATFGEPDGLLVPFTI